MIGTRTTSALLLTAAAAAAIGLCAPAGATAAPVPSATDTTTSTTSGTTTASSPASTSSPATTSSAAISSSAPTTPASTSSPAAPAATSSPASTSPGPASTSPSATSTTRTPTAAAGPPCTTNADATTPVICLPAGFGEDQHGTIVIGGQIVFAGQIVNNGPAVSDAVLAITLPTQLRLGAQDPVVRTDDWYDNGGGASSSGTASSGGNDSGVGGTALTCSASQDGSTITCRTGALAAGANVLVGITLVASPSAQADTSATFTVALQPTQAEGFPVTSVHGTVDFLLPARLSTTITPATSEVVVGRSENLQVTVHNIGPGAAPNAFALTLLLGKANADGPTAAHFAITNAPDVALSSLADQLPAHLPGNSSVVVAARIESTRTSVRSHAAASNDPLPLAIWPIGTIPVGANATFTVRVKAQSVGTDALTVAALSRATDPACAANDSAVPPDCIAPAVARLTALAAHTDGSGNPVANTGAGNLDAQLALAFLALSLGAGLTVAGRRPYRPRHIGRT